VWQEGRSKELLARQVDPLREMEIHPLIELHSFLTYLDLELGLVPSKEGLSFFTISFVSSTAFEKGTPKQGRG
jgi:hypothetical protein